MSFDTEPNIEKGSRGGKKPKSTITLQSAVELGEYQPDYLATFAEWHTLSPHVQLQFIRQGMENRRKQLLHQWAELSNAIDFRLKPELKKSMDGILEQVKKIDRDREKIYLDYSKELT